MRGLCALVRSGHYLPGVFPGCLMTVPRQEISTTICKLTFLGL